MEGLKNEVICYDLSIKDYLPFEPLSYQEQSVRASPGRTGPGLHPLVGMPIILIMIWHLKLYESQTSGYLQRQILYSYGKKTRDSSPFFLQDRGQKGMVYFNWLWRLRGLLTGFF